MLGSKSLASLTSSRVRFKYLLRYTSCNQLVLRWITPLTWHESQKAQFFRFSHGSNVTLPFGQAGSIEKRLLGRKSLTSPVSISKMRFKYLLGYISYYQSILGWMRPLTKQVDESFFTYDVFLSFRGEDTRDNFIAHLHNELSRQGINTFLDDKGLRAGDDISPALYKAIEDSKICIIVFSKHYATSTWCLAELVKILDCVKSNRKQIAFPIFYHVDPSDVRKVKNSYEDAMIEQEHRFGKDSEKVVAWRSALSEVANLKGQHITAGNERTHIENIVKEVYANIDPKPLLNVEEPVGLEERIEKVKSLLDMKPNDDTVSMLGIYGLGGIGKTELVKALYNRIVHQFQAASFLADVGEKSKKINGMEDLQSKLLSEMNEELKIEFGSTSRGMCEIKSKLQRKKVLLVLDDVVDIDSLKQLAGACDWFGPGSRIVITTRDKKLLDSHQVKHTYKMTELSDQHSLELFCRKAFKQSLPKMGYEALSYRAVGYAKGLPLALKVIGSDLATESLDAWESVLEEYERSYDGEIQDVLKKSYDRLRDNAKCVFLDIACFFKGERKEYVETILEEFGAKSNIGVLVNKSLLTIEDGLLKMHDLIQEMGRAVVMNESKIPGKRSRLWLSKDIIEVLRDDSGSDVIEGIVLDPPQREEVDWSGSAFTRMTQLRILIVQNTSFTIAPKYLPNNLRLLDWLEYPSQSFPPNFHPSKIINFRLQMNNLTLEEPFKKFSSLTYMDFSNNQSIFEMPDVSEVQNLRGLRLDACSKLIGVHESVGFLKHLVYFSAFACMKLKNFPRRMSLPSLQFLDLSFCSSLEHFPDITDKMDRPLKIIMISTSIKKLPDSIDNLTGLVSMDIGYSHELKYIPSSFFTLPNLESFNINECPELRRSFVGFVETRSTTCGDKKLKTLSFEDGELSDEDLEGILNFNPNLEQLIVPGNNFVSLPTCIKESIHLTTLDVSNCKKLERIPECSKYLRVLNVSLCENLKEISELPCTIQKIDARCCYSLTGDSSNILWSQVKNNRNGLEMVMPETDIPESYNFMDDKGGNPHFKYRGKLPVITLAMVFQDDVNLVVKDEEEYLRGFVELNLVINNQYVPCKFSRTFRVEAHHVLICDLRLFFTEDERFGLNTFILDDDWNHVVVTVEIIMSKRSLTLSRWGFFVQEGMVEDDALQFIPNTTSTDCLVIILQDFKEVFSSPTPSFFKKQDAFSWVGKVWPESWLLGIMKNAKNNLAMKEGKSIDLSSTTIAEELQQDIDPIQDGFLMEIFLDGILDGLREAQRHFPDLDVDTTAFAAYNKGNKVVLQLPQSMVEVEPPVEMKKHIEGIIIGLKEAKLSFPDLDLQGILNTVLSRGASYPKIGIVKRAMEVGESSASTSGLKGKISTEELQDIDPHQQEELLMGIFYNGIVDGLVQAKSHFPDLDIDTTATNAFTNGKKFMMLLPLNLSMLENDGGCEPPIEKKKYIEGIIIGLFQAKLSFPDLDVRGIVNIVLARGARNNGEVGPIEALPPSVPTLDWSNVTVEDPLSQVFMMMKQESLEYEANNGGGYLKLKEEHRVLRNRLFEQVTENEAATLVDEDTNSFPSWKKQYDELMEKLNDASDSKFCVGKNDKLAAVLKGRDEELRRLCDDGIEGFQRSQEFQDLMSAIYLNGLRDGILEARALLLALDMDTTETPSPLVSEENEERVTVDTPEEDVAEVPSATGPEGFNPPPDTSTPSALDVDYHLEDDDFGRFFF